MRWRVVGFLLFYFWKLNKPTGFLLSLLRNWLEVGYDNQEFRGSQLHVLLFLCWTVREYDSQLQTVRSQLVFCQRLLEIYYRTVKMNWNFVRIGYTQLVKELLGFCQELAVRRNFVICHFLEVSWLEFSYRLKLSARNSWEVGIWLGWLV